MQVVDADNFDDIENSPCRVGFYQGIINVGHWTKDLWILEM